jgi:hypothetical protein
MIYKQLERTRLFTCMYFVRLDLSSCPVNEAPLIMTLVCNSSKMPGCSLNQVDKLTEIITLVLILVRHCRYYTCSRSGNIGLYVGFKYLQELFSKYLRVCTGRLRDMRCKDDRMTGSAQLGDLAPKVDITMKVVIIVNVYSSVDTACRQEDSVDVRTSVRGDRLGTKAMKSSSSMALSIKLSI